MRKLTVRRKFSPISSSRSIKIYIEDPTGDMCIVGFKCRLLGEVKNNSSVTFEIPCEKVRIFAIYGKLSRNYRNDYFIVPEGEEDYFVLGFCKIDREAGSTFRFDVAPDEEIIANRQKCADRKSDVFMASLCLPLCGVMLVLGIVGLIIALV